MASTELVDIVDADNKVVGTVDVETAHTERLMHRVVGIFVYDRNGSLFLQSGNKFQKIDLSVGGHVQAGESYAQAAQRELKEELGLDIEIAHVSTFLPKVAHFNHYWAIYIATAPPNWNFVETEEVQSVTKMETLEIIKMLGDQPDLFTHGFKNAFEELIRVQTHG